MGFEQLKLTDFHFVDFSAGWYPQKNKNDVPGAYFTSKKTPQDLRNGFIDCQNIIWYNGSLRKWFGYDVVNSTQVASGANGSGLGYVNWRSENTQFSVFAAKFYENVGGLWTDRTAAISITTDIMMTFKTHIQGTNRYVIGGNGTDNMIRWNGAGNNITNLGGSPLKFHSFDYYGNRWWGVIQGNSWGFVYGSDETDPTSNWNTSGVQIPFKDTPFGVINVNTWLAVVCRNSIGAIEGFGETTFRKDEQIISVGSSAHRTLCKGQFFDPNIGWVDGFYMVGYTGPYFISESRKLYPLGNSMKEAWNDTTGLNRANLTNAVGAWWDQYKLYCFCVPWGTDTYPTQMFIIDATSGAVWPMPSIMGSTNVVRGLAVLKDSNEDEWLYIQDDDGYVYKFDPSVKNYNPSKTKTAINAYGQTKVYDLNGVFDLREPQAYAKASGNWNVLFFFRFDSDTGEGAYNDLNLSAGADLLDTTFVLDAAALQGVTYVFNSIDVGGAGQRLQIKIQNANADEDFNLEELTLWMKFLRQTSLR